MGHALARAQANARAAVYAETSETVRAQGPAEVLHSIASTADAPALASMLSEIEQRTGIAVTVDELTRLWATSLATLENVETWRTAQVPDRWRSELEQLASEAVATERDTWAQVEEEGRRHQAGWSFDAGGGASRAAPSPRARRRRGLRATARGARLARTRRPLMPVDPTMVDAMLGTFRDLLSGVRTAGSTGEDVDEMAAALAAMEAVGQELSDVGDFSAKLAGGGYYQRFTDAYTRVMTAAAGGGTTGAPAAIPEDKRAAGAVPAGIRIIARTPAHHSRPGRSGRCDRALAGDRSFRCHSTRSSCARSTRRVSTRRSAGTITPSRETLLSVAVEQALF